MDAAAAILVAATLSCAGPVYLDWRTNARLARNRTEDMVRQDEVARKVDGVASAARIVSDDTASQLRQIHTLVNSDMTAARQGELDQTRISLFLLRKIGMMAQAAGHAATAEEAGAIAAAEERVKELEGIIADRLEAAAVAGESTRT